MEVSRLQPCIQLQLSNEEFQNIIDKAKDWALMHGISIRSKEAFNKNQVQVLPFTLLPSAFPRKNFEKAKNIQVLLNELIHKVAHNHSFLSNSLKSTIDADPFTAKLFSIYETVHKEGYGQTISVGLLRSDYMLHENEIKQVELNTIASSFGGIATVTSRYHKYILSELGHADKIEHVPENNPISGLCKGLTYAWKLYDNNQAVILFIVESITYNICDQRFHEFEIRKLNPNIKVIRQSLRDLVPVTKLGPNNELIVGNQVVSVVYFRSGYEVEAYPTDEEWSVRLLIERSRAIKCPSIQYHLAGTKKIQQSLAYPNALDIFLKETGIIKEIQEVFAGLYSLEFNDEGDAIIEKAKADPQKYVLKPQREGGGNNIYNENIREQLESMKFLEERTGWILMDRLYPPVQKNYIVRAQNEPFEKHSLSLFDVVSELGIYGVVIGDHENIMYNECVGHILRTKPSNENEGGIAAGNVQT
ncbi:PREDICTED: glutathione synthetase-like [Dufourea novaeangliae]|uniref:Glutathione synthetase n=1 Tax=Dufourea novaeangliae TaxID=178035 RepID=A0A154NY35_DUFNO|nr:PREDICTED: glutathione synthetase-like [Dufourea novaeangliae]KZC04586.1 Glutathione synthetase [Dufourea novaeangliae]